MGGGGGEGKPASWREAKSCPVRTEWKKSMICLFHSSSSKAKDNLNNKRPTEEKNVKKENKSASVQRNLQEYLIRKMLLGWRTWLKENSWAEFKVLN